MSDKISHQLKKKCATSSHVIAKMPRQKVPRHHTSSHAETFHLFGLDHIGHHRIDDFDMLPIGTLH